MQTQAYFDDIQFQILHEIRKATSSIHIAVAWFTDPDIFEQLCQMAGSGIRVELIVVNDSINRKSGLQYERLRDLGGMFMMVGDNKKNSILMHNKFCVIDSATVITGSYNWSRRAQQNSENITVNSDHPELAQQFIDEFDSLIERHSGKGMGDDDFGKIVARLEVLHFVIELDDKEDVELQLAKLKKLLSGSNEYDEVKKIVSQIEAGQLDQAIAAIKTFVHFRKQTDVYVDPKSPDLTMGLKALEIQRGSLDDEKSELEKLLHTFNYRHEIDAYQQAIRINPEYAEAWKNLGLVYRDSNQPANAIAAYQQALRINPEDAGVWNNLGIAYGEYDQPAKAIEAYQQTVRINPDFPNAWHSLGIAYIKSNQPAKAIEACQQAVRITPDSANASANLGVAYQMSGQTAKVMEVYKRLKTLDPVMADEFFNKFVMPQ